MDMLSSRITGGSGICMLLVAIILVSLFDYFGWIWLKVRFYRTLDYSLAKESLWGASTGMMNSV